MGYAIQEERMNNIKIAGRLPEDVLLSTASRNDEPVLGAVLEKLVLTISDDEKQQILNRWLGVRYEHRTDYSVLVRLVVMFVIASGAFIFWLVKLRTLNLRLQEVNRQLETLNTQKNYYFSVIGHDLRNPFMSIVGYSESLKNEISLLSAARSQKCRR